MSVTIKVDVTSVASLAVSLNHTADVLADGAARAVNIVAADERKDSVKRVVSQVNLPESYVDERVEISRHATREKPIATIRAPVRATLLTRFGAKVQTKTNDWTEAKFTAKFGKGGWVRPNPKVVPMPWTPRTGDPLRGIAAGKKSAGVGVSIAAGGGRKSMPHAFLITLRNGNGMGVFARPASGGKPKARYGPSVDQIVRREWKEREEIITDTLQAIVIREVTNDVNRTLETK